MKELQNKTTKDLIKFISDTREELRAFRFKAAGTVVRDIKAINQAKRELARALTELNARTIAERKA